MISIEKIKVLIPGLSIAFIIAVISKTLASSISSLNPATTSILLGILLGNTVFNKAIFNKGTKLAESKLLEISVVLLGITITFQTISHIGIKGVIYIIIQMLVTIIITYRIGKALKLSTNMSLLMAGGNAVCGSSAIASISPAINAKEYEKGQVITIVNLLGTIMMLILPIIATSLYEDVITKSALIGGTLQSVGQVVASASMINIEAVEWAMIFKIIRIMMLVFVTYSFGKFKSKKEEVTKDTSGKRIFLPWYVIGFVITCVINSLVNIPNDIVSVASITSNWFEIIALAAIGLRLDFRKFFSEGRKFLIYSLIVGVFQITMAISLIYIFSL